MRHLHPTSSHEKFVASGIYTLYRDHRPTGLIEYWSMYELPDGASVIRVDHDGREFDGRSVLVEAWCSPNRRIERFDLHRYGDREDRVRSFKARYTFFNGYVHVGSVTNDSQEKQIEMLLPVGCLVRPTGEVFTGFMMAQLARRAGKLHPVYSNTLSYDDPEAPAGRVTQIAAALRGHEDIEIAGKIHHARRLERHFAQPDIAGGSPLCWLDAYDILLQCRILDYPASILTQYARRPESKPL